MSKVSHSSGNAGNSGGLITLCAVGYSARALAESCRCKTDQVVVIDHFADRDLALCAQANHQVGNWSDSGGTSWLQVIQHLEAGHPGAYILLGGGMENLPQVVAHFSRKLVVLGPSPEQLIWLRDPRLLFEVATAAGLRHPGCFDSPPHWQNTSPPSGVRRVPQDHLAKAGAMPPADQPPEQNWLCKRILSSGGLGVQKWRRGEEHARSAPSPMGDSNALALPEQLPLGDHSATGKVKNRYWQPEIVGRSLGITCILSQRRPPRIVGATCALDRQSWPGPSEFAYRGSWGPVPLTDSQTQLVTRFVSLLQSETDYVGWLQLDFMVDSVHQLWLLEANPRWTAGMDILRRSGANPLLPHLAAWTERAPALQTALDRGPSTAATPPRKLVESTPLGGPSMVHAKAIVYADRQYVPRQTHLEQLWLEYLGERGSFGDIPSPQTAGLPIEAGQPILTVYASLSINSLHQIDSQREEIQRKLVDGLTQKQQRVLQILADG